MPIDKFEIEQYNTEHEDLLEYVINVANEFATDISIDDSGVPYKGTSQAPIIFKRRYNNGKLNTYFKYEDYTNTSKTSNESVIDIIQALNIDTAKFWYLAYLRQSTKKQEISGLGIEAQREIIHNF